jgi:GntR family transcriptional repressor for pyruvate dehydrogenase complex
MGVSRATLREAIAALRQADMVRTVRGRGGGTVVVYEPPEPAYAEMALGSRRDELLDSLVFRRLVEPGACWVAAQRSKDGELTDEERVLLSTALEEVGNAPDAAAHRQADSRLHLALASVTASPMTVRAVTEVQAALHEMLQRIPVLEANLEHSHRQHRAIVNAVLGGDAAKARQTMEEHCDDTAALLRGLLG